MLLSLQDIHKSYFPGGRESNILQGISLDVQEGEYVAIMGHSGSGKSTFLNIVGLLDTPTTGAYLFDGDDVAQLDDDARAKIRNERIGFVFQSFHLLPRTSALDNVCLPMIYRGVSRKQQVVRATELLEEVGLGHRLHNHPNELSGGEQQRVAIARALANEPRILLADEPTGNLDSTSTEDIMELFRTLADKGHTIVMITHEDNVAAEAARVITISDGRIISDVS